MSVNETLRVEPDSPPDPTFESSGTEYHTLQIDTPKPHPEAQLFAQQCANKRASSPQKPLQSRPHGQPPGGWPPSDVGAEAPGSAAPPASSIRRFDGRRVRMAADGFGCRPYPDVAPPSRSSVHGRGQLHTHALGPTARPCRLSGARALPRAVREPVRRARAVADPERRRRRLRSVDRNCRSAPDRRGAARGGRCAPRRTLARAVLATGSAGAGSVLVALGSVASALAPSFATLALAQVPLWAGISMLLTAAIAASAAWSTPESQDTRRRDDVRRAARSVDRRDAADRRRRRSRRLAPRVPRPAAPRGAARRARRRRTATGRTSGGRRNVACAAFSAARRRVAGRSASCSRRRRGRERSSTPARS